MLCVTTPKDPITARAKMDLMEMEDTVLVNICNTVWFNASLVLWFQLFFKALNFNRHWLTRTESGKLYQSGESCDHII